MYTFLKDAKTFFFCFAEVATGDPTSSSEAEH